MSPTFLLVLSAVMCVLHPAAAVDTRPIIQTDHSMGIRSYSFLIDAPQLNSTAYELRVYLRTTCKSGGKQVHVRGFAGAFPLEGAAPKGLSLFAPHFQPPALHQHKLQVISTAANRTTDLKWLGPSNQGLWRFDGKLAPAGREVLTLQGSLHTHQLVLSCAGLISSQTAAHSSAQRPANSSANISANSSANSSTHTSAQQSVLPQEGTWNVITTTSANKMSSETLAHLLSLHMQYHQRLGFNGTILRCNKGEAQELAVLPHIEILVASRQLMIWPWVHEHSTGHTPFYWQKPRNQLTLLAAYGTKLKLTFFDLDEYLVLPNGGTISNSSCAGRPLLNSTSPAWNFVRYSARSCKKGVELECWKEGQALPTASGLELVLEKCPCQYHKPLIVAERVLTLSVHYVWAWGAKVIDIPASCGFLVHLHALVNQRGHFMPKGLEPDHLVPAQWVLPEVGSARVLAQDSTAIAGHLHDFQYCTKLRKDYASMHPGKAKLSIC